MALILYRLSFFITFDLVEALKEVKCSGNVWAILEDGEFNIEGGSVPRILGREAFDARAHAGKHPGGDPWLEMERVSPMTGSSHLIQLMAPRRLRL